MSGLRRRSPNLRRYRLFVILAIDSLVVIYIFKPHLNSFSRDKMSFCNFRHEIIRALMFSSVISNCTTQFSLDHPAVSRTTHKNKLGNNHTKALRYGFLYHVEQIGIQNEFLSLTLCLNRSFHDVRVSTDLATNLQTG